MILHVIWGGYTLANNKLDQFTLEMALVGYEAERARIDAATAAIRARLGQRGRGPAEVASDTAPAGRRRKLSAAARKRIAAAQRKRWAAFRQQGKAAPKRKLSAAGRKRIIEATKKRWAEYRKAGQG